MRYWTILSFYLLALLVGIVTGFVGSCFQIAIHHCAVFLGVMAYKLRMLGIPSPIPLCSITIAVVVAAWFMVRRFAPEAAGSGVQEIEGALLHKRPMRWAHVLPVKFFGGMFAIASNMVLGREGPTIQMGGDIGKLISEFTSLSRKRCDALIAAGAAAGLSAAFNAPLAGVLFVVEEMREAFPISFIQFKIVAISCVGAAIVLQLMLGNTPAIVMDVFQMPSLASLWLFFIFGIFSGFVGILFNRSLMHTLYTIDKQTEWTRFVYVVIVAALIGFLAAHWPDSVGGGYHIIEHAISFSPGLLGLIMLFALRFILTMLCYGTGIPGGIFAPMLAVGSLLGLAFATIFIHFGYDIQSIEPGMFAVAGMGALFSACVRAPMTGIVLVVEMTQNYDLILPLMVSSLTATTVVQLAGVSPIYSQLLSRTMRTQ